MKFEMLCFRARPGPAGTVMLCLKTRSQAHRLSFTYIQWHESAIVLL
jgi:hypothetical protein